MALYNSRPTRNNLIDFFQKRKLQNALHSMECDNLAAEHEMIERARRRGKFILILEDISRDSRETHSQVNTISGKLKGR